MSRYGQYPAMPGHCYPYAYDQFLALDEKIPGEAALVHGTARLPGTDRRVGHAWVRLGTMVFDNLNCSARWSSYERLLGATEDLVIRDRDVALLCLARTSKHGPWTVEEAQDAEAAVARLRAKAAGRKVAR